MMSFRTRRATEPEISLTPMIDVLFMVLMFLLLTTTFQELTFIRVALPEATTAQRDAQEASTRLRILIEADGAMYLDDQPVTREELGRALDAVQDKERADVRVAADERTDHGHVVAVMDLVRRAGIFRLSIETLSYRRSAGSGL